MRDEELREALALALYNEQHQCRLIHYESIPDFLDPQRQLVDALLPVVRRYADQRAAQVLAPFRELFAGGPDTVCRTAWRPALPGPGMHRPPSTECVEVPMEDLRDAFDRADALTAEATT